MFSLEDFFMTNGLYIIVGAGPTLANWPEPELI